MTWKEYWCGEVPSWRGCGCPCSRASLELEAPMSRDATLTPYERKCWRQLQRQLETDDAVAAAGLRSRRRALVVVIGIVVLLLLVAVKIGGVVALAAAGAYIFLFLALWGLSRAVWRIEPRRGSTR